MVIHFSTEPMTSPRPPLPLGPRGVVAGVDLAAQLDGLVAGGANAPARKLSDDIAPLDSVDAVVDEKAFDPTGIAANAEAGGFGIRVK